MASEPSDRTGTSSARPGAEETLRLSFAARRHGGSAFPVSLVNITRPSMCQAASAASKRPGSSKTGREPIVPKAAVSAGMSPMPCTCTLPTEANVSTALSFRPHPVPPTTINASTSVCFKARSRTSPASVIEATAPPAQLRPRCRSSQNRARGPTQGEHE